MVRCGALCDGRSTEVSEQPSTVEEELASTSLPADAAADMRRALLEAGKTEFANHGYDGARLERIVAKVGCAKRMLYYYFGNKKTCTWR